MILEKKVLSEVVIFKKGFGISKNELSFDGIPCIRYGELYTKYSETTSKTYSKTIYNEKLIISKGNEVILPSSGETSFDMVSSCAITISGVALGGDINILECCENLNNIYLSYYLRYNKRKEIMKLVQGISVMHLYNSHLSKLEVHLPSLDKQKQIGNFLSNVDKLIESKREEIKLKEEYKKGIIQKIFNKEIRFKDEDGNYFPEWEGRIMGDICDIRTGNRDVKDSVCDGKYDFYIRSKEVKKIDSFSFKGEAILIGGDGKIEQLMHYANGKFDYHQRVYKISSNLEFNTLVYMKYLFLYLRKYLGIELMKVSAKTTVDSVRMPTLTNFNIWLPRFEEQKKISKIIFSLEKAIESNVREVIKIQEIKNNLLKKLFEVNNE